MKSAALLISLTWSVTGVSRQKAKCIEESKVRDLICQLQSGYVNISCRPNIACKEMVSALHLGFVRLLALTWTV